MKKFRLVGLVDGKKVYADDSKDLVCQVSENIENAVVFDERDNQMMKERFWSCSTGVKLSAEWF